MRFKIALLSCLLLVAAGSLFAQGGPIAKGATVFIEPNEGFESFLRAAFQKKNVPLTVVLDKTKAQFILTSVVERGEKPGLATAIFLGKRKANEDASVTLVNVESSAVHFAYSVHKYNARNGQQSTAESIAKNLKNRIEKGK